MPISGAYFKNRKFRFLEEPKFVIENKTSVKNCCPVLRQKPSHVLPFAA